MNSFRFTETPLEEGRSLEDTSQVEETTREVAL